MAVCADQLFKVLVIGELGVGKSSVILRYVKKRFNGTYKASVGVDFAMKTVDWDPRTVVRLQLWDIAGQEQFKEMSRVFYKGAMGALVVFDLSKGSTLEAASAWKQDLDSKIRLESGGPIPAVLLANKCDLAEWDQNLCSSLDHFCKENSFLGWFETSAKDNVNIDEAALLLIQHMMQCRPGRSSEDDRKDGIKVNLVPEETCHSQSQCCGARCGQSSPASPGREKREEISSTCFLADALLEEMCEVATRRCTLRRRLCY
ncbi:ras-related protein Rab-32 [Lampris incognitus]|uniref:ras-related protein Rab-32 n=1 Tax=Lampris incognitus TaxID=2546036 RepID=UPI0024B51D26|nr:ras-related protein Rab-32 [Lampris incognitus]